MGEKEIGLGNRGKEEKLERRVFLELNERKNGVRGRMRCDMTSAVACGGLGQHFTVHKCTPIINPCWQRVPFLPLSLFVSVVSASVVDVGRLISRGCRKITFVER